MMSDNRPTDMDHLEAYLDNLLSDEEVASFLSKPENRQQLVGQTELQLKIDESIRHSFQFDPPSEEKISQIADKITIGNATRSRIWHRQNLTRLALAASLFVIAGLGIWQVTKSWRVTEPFFQPRSLAKIYDETVNRGFSPYYECHDPQRFAEVFSKRQGQRLGLGELPEGSRMLGISYLGGLSRDTTAMLCEVGNDQVIVFVDTAKHDQPAVAVFDSDTELNAFRVVENGLVFYEVSPLNNSTMIEHFVFLE